MPGFRISDNRSLWHNDLLGGCFACDARLNDSIRIVLHYKSLWIALIKGGKLALISKRSSNSSAWLTMSVSDSWTFLEMTPNDLVSQTASSDEVLCIASSWPRCFHLSANSKANAPGTPADWLVCSKHSIGDGYSESDTCGLRSMRISDHRDLWKRSTVGTLDV